MQPSPANNPQAAPPAPGPPKRKRLHPDFWHFAARMLRHRRQLVGSLLFALIGASGLGAGLLVIQKPLQIILESATTDPEQADGLPEIAAQINSWTGPNLGVTLPQAWVDSLPDGPFTAVVVLVLALAALTMVGAVANFLQAYFALTVVARTVAGIRADAFRHALHLPLRTIMSTGPTFQVQRILVDSGALFGGMTTLLGKAVPQVAKGIAAIAAAFVINPWLTIAALAGGAPLGYVIKKIGTRIRRAARRGLQAQTDLLLTTSEALDHLRVVKTSLGESRETRRFDDANAARVAQEMRIRTARAMGSPLVETITIFVLGGLTLVACKMILDRHLAMQDFFVTLGALGIAGAALRPLTGLLNDLQESSAAAERLREMFGQTLEDGHDAARPALPRHAREIEFRRVSVTYPRADHPSVSDVSLAVRHGETVAIVGANGSGKTTLLSLLPRLLDPDPARDGRPAGQVLIDGVDTRSVSLASLRGQIGVVTQETMLFRGTLRSNIAYGLEHATDEQIRAAARRARAEDFILARPGGYDAPVGEKGSGLSGGQRQRLAIARAILRDPAILILDEATSMIDADSERQIAAALAEFSAGRTCLIVAHRLSTVIHADRIVVMDHGRIADVGTHDELLARSPAYRLIAEHQLVRAPAAAPGPAAGEPVA